MTDFHHLFRGNASDTSIAAAASIDLTHLEQVVLNAVRDAGTAGITQDELLQKLPHLSYSSVTARPATLKTKGLIFDSGLRREGRSGRKQAVLVAAEYRKAIA